MPRPPKFDRGQILAAARQLVAERGPAGLSMQQVAGRLGAPSGSLYHRYPTRDHLLADLWLDAVERFQRDFVGHLEDAGPSSAEKAAGGAVAWCRRHPHDAMLLMSFRRSDLLGEDWPEDVRARAEASHARLEAALDAFARRRGARSRKYRRRLRLALVDLPYAVVRSAFSAGHPPTRLDQQVVEEAVTSLLEAFDRRSHSVTATTPAASPA